MNKTGNTFTDLKVRPYEKFLRFGPENLTESELLAILLRTGTNQMSAEQLAVTVLKESYFEQRGLSGLHQVSLEQLMNIPGIGQVKAIQIKALMEFSKRVAQMNAHDELQFNRSESVATYYMESLRHRNTEVVIAAFLDSKCHFLKETELFRGTVKASLISPREVFIEALKAEAVLMILLHNHPSGDPTPSEDDRRITDTIAELGKRLDILLIDHIIIGDNKYISFKEQGYL